MEGQENESISLTCATELNVDAKPECYSFRWFKVGGNSEEYPRQTQNRTLEIIVNKTSEGKYTCICENLFGESALSDPSEVMLSVTGTNEFYLKIHLRKVGREGRNGWTCDK